MKCADSDASEQSNSSVATPPATIKTKYNATSDHDKITQATTVAKMLDMDNMDIVIANRREKIAIIREAHKAKNYVKQQRTMFA